MRRFFTGAATLAAALVLAAAPANAQFFAASALTLPSGDFGDGFKAGWAANAGISIWQNGDERAKVWVEGLYGQNNLDSDIDGKSTMIGGFGSLTYNLTTGGSAVPYLIGSAGYLSQKIEVASVDDTEGGFAFGGGAGVGFGKFYLEGRYITASIADGTTSFIMAAAGITF